MNQTFYLDTPEIKANCIGFISMVDIDSPYKVEIEQLTATELRHEAQNRLMWHWNKEIATQRGDVKPDYVHGESKLIILQPLYFEFGGAAIKRAQFVQDILDHIPEYKKKVVIDYDMVRSRKLGVKRFCEYLNRMEQHWSGEGFVLTTKQDLYAQAMGGAA